MPFICDHDLLLICFRVLCTIRGADIADYCKSSRSKLSSFKPIFDDAEAEMQTRGVLASLAYISRSKRLEEFNYLSSSIDEIS